MIAVIGSFDGFHAGHRALLGEAEKLARQNNTSWAVVTFSPHPGVYFEKNKKLLLSEYEKCAAAKFLGIPEVIKLPFDRIYDMAPENFLEMLTKRYSVDGIVVGEDFRFGRAAAGNCALIRNFCTDNALPFEILMTVKHSSAATVGGSKTVGGSEAEGGSGEAGSEKISASILREWYGEGKTDFLRSALTFPCPISGIVVHGDGRGAKLGFPTVNISVPAEKMLPAEGVYAVSVLTAAEWRAGAMFVGRPPMFREVGEARAEVHISDFSGDLYGERVTVFLEEFVRPPTIFKDERELARDVKSCAAAAVRVFNEKHESDAGKTLYTGLLNAFRQAGFSIENSQRL